MKPPELIAAFETLADAPDGVKRLRELVLQLAVRGSLVPQNPADEPAVALLEAVRAERRRRWVASQQKPYVQPTYRKWNGLFDALLDGWSVASVEELTDPIRTVSYGILKPGDDTPGGIPYVKVKDIRLKEGDIVIDKIRRTTPEIHRQFLRSELKTGDVLVSIRGTVGKVARVPAILEGGNITQDSARLAFLEPMCVDYLVTIMRSPLVQAYWAEFSKGAAVQGLNIGDLRPTPLPIPPLAEQRRIVERVNELMGLLDRLEAARTAREQAHRTARDAALAALRNAEDAEAVDAAWVRVSGQMDALFTAPDDVVPLRQAILQLAVLGRLTSQNPQDEPASVIVERSEQERRAVSARLPKLPEVAHECMPSLPDGWSWIRLGTVLRDVQAGWSPEAEKRPKEQDEWGVLKVSACSWGRFKPEENKALLPGTDPRIDLEVKPGDFLISRANTVDLVARSVVVDATPPRLMLSDKTLRLVPTSVVDVRYLNIANGSDIARRHYAENATGTSDSMRNVSQDSIRAVPIPLPPLAEQHRIVAKVDALMTLCDQLEARLTAARELQAQFAAAAVHHLDV